MRNRLHAAGAIVADDRGATIVEFALVVPILLGLLVGGIYTAMLGFTQSSLTYATKAGARCASINPTTCTNSTTTAAYAKQKYMDIGLNAPTFTATTAACGNQVTGTVTFSFNTGVKRMNVPLSASTCYP